MALGLKIYEVLHRLSLFLTEGGKTPSLLSTQEAGGENLERQ